MFNTLNKSFADIDLDFVKNYLRVESDFKDDDKEIEIFMAVAKDFILHVTDLTEEEFAKANTLVPAYLILISELYTSRSATVPSNTKANLILHRYLDTKRKFI